MRFSVSSPAFQAAVENGASPREDHMEAQEAQASENGSDPPPDETREDQDDGDSVEGQAVKDNKSENNSDVEVSEQPPVLEEEGKGPIEDEQGTDGRLYQSAMNTPCVGGVLKNWPRTSAFCCGVVVPLFFLIFISLFFGIILARLESATEVEANDDQLAKRFVTRRVTRVITNITVHVGRVCLQAYMTGLNATPFSETLINLILQDATTFQSDEGELFRSLDNNTNITEVYDFLVKCGEGSRVYADQKLQEANDAVGESLDPLTFNWIRCYSGASDLKVDLSGDLLRSTERNPTTQNDFYTTNWENDYDRLFEEYVEDARAHNDLAALFEASDRALEDATGGDQCYLNGSGSAWFWFTVQTTIGYGNQAPESQGGRALVFTAGFVCILAFGAVLATSGRIVLAISDDLFKRSKFSAFLAKPVWSCLFWGALWYIWMAMIGYVYIKWREVRLDEKLPFGDSYWFAYISTTTVGLGDFFLEPEVIVGIDLLYFPLLFLFGFTLLSAFLGKFSELVMNAMTMGRRSFVDSLLAQFDDGTESSDK